MIHLTQKYHSISHRKEDSELPAENISSLEINDCKLSWRVYLTKNTCICNIKRSFYDQSRLGERSIERPISNRI